MKLHRFVLIPALLMVVGGCTVTPKPVYRAYPLDGTDIWSNGVEVVSAEAEGVEMAMAFNSNEGGLLVFDVEFENRGDAPVTIDPALFHYEVAGRATLVVHALDPEQQLLASDMVRSRQVARRAEQTGNDALFGFLDLVADVSSTEGQTEAEKQREIEEDQEAELTRLREAQEHESAMQAINAGRYRWADETLRKTTLAPGHCIGGRVRFQPGNHSTKATFRFPVGGRNLEARYRVEKHDVGRR